MKLKEENLKKEWRVIVGRMKEDFTSTSLRLSGGMQHETGEKIRLRRGKTMEEIQKRLSQW